ncbi:RpiR family transcriptional regulator [Crenobacter luteus]|nr:RpiR family transcriptional regulator [Crenobacter luteus]
MTRPDTPVGTGLLDEIATRLPKLSAAEARVGELVLSRPESVQSAPVAEIARLAGVSQPTVIRFCRSLGASGLSDFKLKLARSSASGVPYVHAAVRADDAPADIAAKVFDNTMSALTHCRSQIDPAALEAAVARLAEARRIEFYGMGNSGIIAADAQHKFFRFGMATVAYADPHIQTMAASVLTPDDVLVAISNSGRSLEILDAVRVARDSGAGVIALTRRASPLAELADVALTIDVPEDADSVSPMLSRLMHLVLIDILAVGVALRRGPGVIDLLEKTKRNLSGRRLRERKSES